MKHGGEPPFDQHEDWLDLSTGISPLPYPLTDFRAETWQNLPKSRDLQRLIDAARACYQVPEDCAVLAAPGTEALIFALPRIIDRPAHIISPTYSSHAAAWGHTGSSLLQGEPWHDGVTILVNPNNPTGDLIPPDEVRQRINQFGKDDLLIIDEAFVDVMPEHSFIPYLRPDDPVIVLRSFGKFFGLAGMRLGFAVGAPHLIAKLEGYFGEWSVSGPALEIGTTALNDHAWQQTHRAYLAERRKALHWFLTVSRMTVAGATDLFTLVDHEDAAQIHARLAKAGIWTRIFEDHPSWIRFGVTRTDAEMARLYHAIRQSD